MVNGGITLGSICGKYVFVETVANTEKIIFEIFPKKFPIDYIIGYT